MMVSLGAVPQQRYGTIVSKGGWSYQITPDDVLWAARMAACEGGGPKDPAGALWAMTQLFSPAAQRGKYGRVRYTSLGSLLRAYSQCINPSWARGGHFCGSGGKYAGTDRCSDSRLERRRRFRTMRWEQVPADARAVTMAWATARLPNPVPRAVEFADKTVSEGFLRRNPGAAFLTRAGINFLCPVGRCNWFIKTDYTKGWPADYVQIRYKGRIAGVEDPFPWQWLVAGGVAAAGVAGVGFLGYQWWRARQ